MAATDEICLGLSKELSFRPFFSLSAGDNTAFSITEEGNVNLTLEIANSPFESVHQYGLTFQLTGMNRSFPIEDIPNEIDSTGKLELSDLTFHKLLDGAPDELLGYKGGEGENNLTLTLSIADTAPLIFPQYSLPLDYSASFTADNANLLTADGTYIRIGETVAIRAVLGSDLEGFTCRVLVFEQDRGGIPTEWKSMNGDIILKGASEYKAFILNLEAEEEDPSQYRADWHVGVRGGIYDLGGEEGGSPENYEWSVMILLFRDEPEIKSTFSQIDSSLVCVKSKSIAFQSHKPEISVAICSYRAVESKNVNGELITEHHINYRLSFSNVVGIPALNGQILSIVQLDSQEGSANEGVGFFPVDFTLYEDECNTTDLSGTIIMEAQEGVDLGNCRLYLDILSLFNNADHCTEHNEMNPVISNNGNLVVVDNAPAGSDVRGWVLPINRE